MSLDNLDQFTGTEGYHRWSVLFGRHVLTDGAKYLADQAGAYWLMDAIASWFTDPRVRREPFQVWKLTVHPAPEQHHPWQVGALLPKEKRSAAVLTCDDGNGNIVARQEIDYTDFPLPEIKLYCIESEGMWVILLPSEY